MHYPLIQRMCTTDRAPGNQQPHSRESASMRPSGTSATHSASSRRVLWASSASAGTRAVHTRPLGRHPTPSWANRWATSQSSVHDQSVRRSGTDPRYRRSGVAGRGPLCCPGGQLRSLAGASPHGAASSNPSSALSARQTGAPSEAQARPHGPQPTRGRRPHDQRRNVQESGDGPP